MNEKSTESRGIAFTNFQYLRKYNISVTVRDGGKAEALDSLHALIEIINEYIEPIDAIEHEDLTGVPLPPKDEVTGMYLGLLEYAPKSSELKSGQTYELVVNQYKLKDGEVQFWKKGNKYPAHVHSLNDVGVKVMANLFGDKWDDIFKSTGEYEDIPKGDLIIKIEGSKNLTEKNNPYKNLVSIRRP